MSKSSYVNRRSVRGASFVAAIAFVLCGQANAQYIVKDPFGLMAKMEQISKDAAEFGKNAQRWKSTSDHYQQQLIKLQRLNFGQTAMEDSFALRPLDYGMDDTCSGPGRGIKDQLIGAFKQAAPQLDGNVVNEQLAICQRMVYAENRKYNDSVTMLKTLLQRSREFGQIEQQLGPARLHRVLLLPTVPLCQSPWPRDVDEVLGIHPVVACNALGRTES